MNVYAMRENDPIWETMSERMHNIIMIESVGYLTFEVRRRADRKKRDTHRAKIAPTERISAEF